MFECMVLILKFDKFLLVSTKEVDFLLKVANDDVLLV